MNLQEIRIKNNFSQLEMAVLLNVPVGELRSLEEGTQEPSEEIRKLYTYAENSLLSFTLFSLACERRYSSVQEVRLVLSMIPRFSSLKLHRAILEMNVVRNNSHFKPEDLGIKVTKVYVRQKGKKSK